MSRSPGVSARGAVMKRTRTLFTVKELHDDDVAAGIRGFIECRRGSRRPVTVTRVERLASGFITFVDVVDEPTGDVVRARRMQKTPEGTPTDTFFARLPAAATSGYRWWRLRLGQHDSRPVSR